MIRTLNRIIPTALRAFQTPVARPLLRSLMTDTRATALKPSLWGAQRSMGLPNNGRWGTTLPRFVSTTATLAPLTPKAHYERAIAKGKPLGDFRDWRIRTAGADVSFKTEGNGQVWPALVLEKITFVDPKPRDLIQENLQNFTHVTTLEELNDVIVKLIQTESPYLRVTDTKSKALNENHGITNLRRQAFIRALRESALGQTQLSPSDRVKALGVIETTNLKLATGRNYVMKVGSHTNYWPYWKNYIPPLVRLLEQHKEGDPGWHQIKNRISDILRRKTAHNRTLDEKDIEKTMNLALVMRPMFSNNMGHRVSMAKDSTTFNPKYELLSIAKTGLPEGFEEYAGIQLVREEQGTIRVDFMSETDSTAAKLSRKKMGQKIPAALLDFVESWEVPKSEWKDLNFREFVPTERPRRGVPMDWNNDGEISFTKTDISWWGHCHNEAPLNAMDIDPQKGVSFYRATPGLNPETAMQYYSAAEIWDIAGAFVSDHEGGYTVVGSGSQAKVDSTTFVGIRNRGRNTLSLQLPHGTVQLTAELVKLVNAQGKDFDPKKAFRPYMENDDGTFDVNPFFAGENPKIPGLITIDVAKHEIKLETEFITFAINGHRMKAWDSISIMPGDKKFIKIGEEITSLNPDGRGGELTQHFYNAHSEEYYSVIKAVNPNNNYVPVEIETSEPVKITGIMHSSDTEFDSSKELFEFYMENPGLPKTYDTSPGEAVWNYPVNKESFVMKKEATRVEGGKAFTYRTFELSYTTMGGPGKKVNFILKYNEAGEIVADLGLDPLPDFAYRYDRWVSAPVTSDANGKTAVNANALRNGYLLNRNGNNFDDVQTDLWKSQAAILYAGLSNTSIIGTAFLFETQDGEFIRFTNREDFLAAVEADKKLQK